MTLQKKSIRLNSYSGRANIHIFAAILTKHEMLLGTNGKKLLEAKAFGQFFFAPTVIDFSLVTKPYTYATVKTECQTKRGGQDQPFGHKEKDSPRCCTPGKE